MTKPSTTTRALRITQLVATGALTATLIHAHTPWWAWTIVIIWGFITGLWAFCAALDSER